MEISSGVFNLNQFNNTVSIGRSSACDIVLNDFTVSRRHAEIIQSDNGYEIRDTDSQSGLYVNDAPTALTLLHSGDEIRIGTHILKYQALQKQHSLYLSKHEDRLSFCNIEDTETIFFGRSKQNKLSYEIPDLPQVFLSAERTGNELTFRALNTQLTAPSGKRQRSFSLLSGEVAHFKQFSLEFSGSEIILYRNTLGANLHTRALHWRHDSFALSDISVTVNPGECVAILGMSGDGKSTLLNCISGAIHPEAGTISIDGKPFSKDASYLEQKAPLYSYFTVSESLHYAAQLVLPSDLTREERTIKVTDLLNLFDLTEVANLLNSKLSGGQQKRLALAIELISSPTLLLLDEPTSGLDPLNDSLLTDYLSGITTAGHTVVMTTHNYNDLHKFNRIILLQKGQLIFQGTPNQALDYFNVDQFHKILDKIRLYNADENREKLKESALILQESTETQAVNTHTWTFTVATRSPFLPTLTRFYKQFFRDSGRVALTISQPFILGILLLLIFDTQSSHWTMAFTLVICSLWYALSNSIKEVVQEKEMVAKELKKGLKIVPYICAKALPLTVLSTFQITVTFFILKLFYGFEWDSLYSFSIFCATSLAGTTLGLLASTLARTHNQALSSLPLILIPQVLFAGALVEVDLFSTIGHSLSHLFFSRWSYDLLKSVFVDSVPKIELFMPIGIIVLLCVLIQWWYIASLKKNR
ncbi:MAG: ATP-binding cassette domain-containing protein [Fibrobacterales bacterium]